MEYTAPIASANQWYIGATQAIYDLGEDSEWNGNIEVGQVGLQLGNNLNDRFSIEAGYGVNFNREDIRMAKPKEISILVNSQLIR